MPSRFSSMLGFQSLSGLFQQSPRGRYSRPIRSERTLDFTQTPSLPKPTFVTETTTSQSEDHATIPVSQRVRYVSEEVQPDSTPFAPREEAADGPGTSHATQNTSESVSRPRRLTRTYGASVPKSGPVPRRRANPFVSTRYLQKWKTSTSEKEVESPVDTSTSRRNGWELNEDAHHALDSTLDPGPTNIAFQPLRDVQQQPPQEMPRNPADSRYAGKPAKSPPSGSAPEVQQSRSKLTHVTASGEAHMVDVGGKEHTQRTAIAHARVSFSNPESARLILENTNKKGDALGVARIAGIMASKRTADLIPLCHPIPISRVEVDVQLHRPGSHVVWAASGQNHYGFVTIHAIVQCVGPTGVEMEALTAVSGAALTVFDMCKAVDRDISFGSTRVMYKSGGRSGVHLHRKWFGSGGKEFMQKVGVDIDGLEAIAEGAPARRRKLVHARNIRRRP